MDRDHLPGTFFGPSTLVHMLRHRVRCQPDDIAFIYLVDGERDRIDVTYTELDRQARMIGAWLEGRGLVGQRALLLYPPGLEFIAAFFGCLYAGVVAVPVYPPRRNRSLDRIQAISDDTDAKVALTTDAVLQRVEGLIDETPHLKQLTWLATCSVQPGTEDRWEMPDIHGDTLAFLQYTSGSTGTPKGVMLNHANLIHNSALIAYAFEHTRSVQGVFWLPLYHDMGLIGGILQPLYLGVPNIQMSPMSFLQRPYRWLSAISRFRGTTSGGPNFAYELCVRKVTPEEKKTLDLSCWNVAFNGAEPVRAETIEAFYQAFKSCGFRREAFYPCFGLAEATLLVSGGLPRMPPVIRTYDADAVSNNRAVRVEPGHPHARSLVGSGEAMLDQKIVIADPEKLTKCPDRTVGEIWVSGPSIALGYWQRPEVTETTFHAYTKDTGEGPFLRTGDLGFLDEGELFVTGRCKDLIIVRGVNHYPQDIELTVFKCSPRLRPDAGAVFTVEADGREQLIVVQEAERRKHGGFGSVFRAIRKAVSEEHDLALDAIVLIKAGSIPKTSSGKIQHHACCNAYLAGELDTLAVWRATDVQEPDLEGHEEEPVAPATAELIAATAEATPAPAAAAVAAAAAAVAPAARTSKNGEPADPHKRSQVIGIVLEQVRAVAKERAAGLTLDMPIIELGMDSLERMEILARLEERFGGRFPEEVLADLETARHVVEAVEKYLGAEPRTRTERPAGQETPPETHHFKLFPEYLRLRQNLDLLESSGIGNPYFTVHQGVINDRTLIGGREYVSFSSYNYVGMSGDPVVTKAAQEAVAKYGTSVSASRLVSGEKDLHGRLEKALCRFLGTEACITFVGGHATNESTIGHLFGPGDLILHDSLSHNSIVQGAILSGARRRPFPHNDYRAADALLEQYRHEYRRVLLVVEGVYSMDGDIPDLPKFVEVRKRHGALLMIDEAHSAGTIGAHGRGIGEYHNVARDDVDMWMGTLSKSFGSCGGYISGCNELVEYLKYTAPGFVFAAGMPPPNAAAALASVELLEAEPERALRLQRRAGLFLSLAQERGLNTGMSQDSPVVPVILGNSMHALALSKALFARGINVQPIVHPAVEESAARLRFFITSLHTEEQIRQTVAILAEEMGKIDAAHVGHHAHRGHAVARSGK